MSTVTAEDGAEIFYKDWGNGKTVLLCHGWPLNADSWESQQFFLASHGCRVIAHDRRGHGRSTQTWDGNNMDSYADDLNALIETLDLRDITLVGFCAGGGEVARYIGRYGTSRVARVALVSAVAPYLLRDDTNAGVPVKVFDKLREDSLRDRSQLYKDFAADVFFAGVRAKPHGSQGMLDAFWAQAMQSGHRNAYECIAAFSATDFRRDLRLFDVPTLVIHGDDDQLVPIDVGGRRAAELIDGAELKVYPGAPHGLTETHKQQLGDDLLAFLNS